MRYLLPLGLIVDCFILFGAHFTTLAYAQGAQEPLLEVPVYSIPKEMTYEDYEAANMRISTGLVQGVLPGGVHFYAKENTTGWVLASTAVLGLVSIIAGGTMTEEVTQTIDDAHIISFKNGDQYEKVPKSRIEDMNGQVTQTKYTLRKLPSEQLNKTGMTLVSIGVIAVLGSYIYDFLHGMEVIETKRSKARYKFGKALHTPKEKTKSSLYFRPQIDPRGESTSLQVGMTF